MDSGHVLAGRYELVERLGRGGMGEVWAARDRDLRRDVALKLLDREGAAHPELPRRFAREAVAAAQISHPNVAALYDRGVHDGVLFLVMEKVEGTTLAEHIRAEDPMPPARALEIADGICEALVAAHRAHVVHYDIKPHNVMLTPDGHVKVVDFGLAGFLQIAFSVTRSSQLSPAGTPEYGAPEQFLTERGDERSDLYALGGVLFALLARRPPFTGPNGLAVIRRKLDEEAPDLDELHPHLPPALPRLVAELLQRDPEQRPRSARQVHERLQHLRAALDPRNTHTSSPETETAPDWPTTVVEPPAPESPFAISWTGKDPLPAYARSSAKGRLGGLSKAGLVLALPGVAIPLLLHRIRTGTGQDDGWMAWFVLSLVLGLFALGILLWLPLMTWFHRTTRSWSLHVGPQGIVITDVNDRSEYRWCQVQGFAIKQIDSGTPFLNGRVSLYRYTGLHVRFTAARSGPSRPAGWPSSFPGTISPLPGRLVPLCVLGPMTEKQRAELAEALARYGSRR